MNEGGLRVATAKGGFMIKSIQIQLLGNRSGPLFSGSTSMSAECTLHTKFEDNLLVELLEFGGRIFLTPLTRHGPRAVADIGGFQCRSHTNFMT